MTYEYGRYHEDGLGEYNYQFMEKEAIKYLNPTSLQILTGPKRKIRYSVTMAQMKLDVVSMSLRVLELQQGGSYKTKSEMGYAR